MVKGVLIGYFGHDAYRIFNPDSQRIFCSCDVVFEKGIGYKMLPLSSGLTGGGDVDEVAAAQPTSGPGTDTGTIIHTRAVEPNTQVISLRL